MRGMTGLACLLLAGVAGAAAIQSQSGPLAYGPTAYEGAKLIAGDGSAPIDNGTFVVERGRITGIGTASSVRVPANAARVDLRGKTVIPALVNVHAHVGYERFTKAGGEARAESFTPANLLNHLQRQAYYGVGTVMDAGSAAIDIANDFLDDQEARKFPAAARLALMAGIVPPGGGPDHILIEGTRPLRANFEVTRAPEARAAVQLSAARGVRHIKIWLGDRNGTYPPMPREIYTAVIDEAHKVGIKVHAHALSMRDQKDALRAGADVIVHSLGSPFDDELIGLVKEKKPYWAPVMGLFDRSAVCENDPFFTQVLSTALIAQIQKENCAVNPKFAAIEEMRRTNFMHMIRNGARLVLGTDVGVFPRYSFGSADHHELSMYVRLGMSPGDALVAATSRAAELIGIPEVGALAVGKQADFLVLDADPLENITNTRKLSAVYLRGALLDRGALLVAIKAPGP